MVAALKILRSLTVGLRPSGRTYGEPYVNFADNQFGVFDSSNVARDLLGVPVFSASATYSAGQAVNNGGKLYIALGAVTAGAFNGAQWSLVQPERNFGQYPITNGKIVESHASNAVTFALKTLAGNDPSVSDQVHVHFSDGVTFTITAAMSLTLPAGMSFGLPVGYCFRLWIGIINQSGTLRLMVRLNWQQQTSANFPNILAWDSRGLTPTTAVTTPGAPGFWYASVTNASYYPWIPVAYCEYGAFAVAGNWTMTPAIYNVGPQTRFPGDLVNRQSRINFGQSAYSGTTLTSSTAYTAFNLLSSFNMLEIHVDGDSGCPAGIYCGATLACNGAYLNTVSQLSYNNINCNFSLRGMIYPNTASVNAGIYYCSSTAGQTVYCPATQANIEILEYMT